MSTARPKRTSKTPSRFNPEAAAEKAEKKKVGVRKTKGKKARKEKDPNAPKRARTPYIIFATEERPKAKEANPNLGFGQLTKVVSDKWKAMSDAEKAPYVEKAAKDKERYASDIKNYKGGDE